MPPTVFTRGIPPVSLEGEWRVLMSRTLIVIGTVAWLATPARHATAQSYRLSIDTKLQSVSFRGVTLDSIRATDARTGATGGFETQDGFAVRCRSDITFCTFFRPGSNRRGGPMVTTADLTVWNLGVPGLSLHSRTRIGVDLGSSNIWPGTQPATQLVEGYAEYASAVLTAQVGRTHTVDRLGFYGFDGARVTVRALGRHVSVTGYGGLGLARGAPLPVNGTALNPLDDFQPSDRQLVAGGALGWGSSRIDGRIVYRREIDPRSDHFVSERVGLDAAVRPVGGVTVSGGVDYDIAAGWLGSAEARIRYSPPLMRASLEVGGRRYRPHFDLRSIWIAFSPSAYRALFGAFNVTLVKGLELRARGEIYEFDETETATPLVTVEDDGWRWSLDANLVRSRWWSAGLDYFAEFGPGGSSIGVGGRTTVTPISQLSVTAQVGSLDRPLEFRFDDVRLWVYGLRAEYEPAHHLRFAAGILYYDEARQRPDAASFDFDRLRVDVGATVTFGSTADLARLPAAILRIPSRPTSR